MDKIDNKLKERKVYQKKRPDRGIGKPTLYKPEYCKLIIDIGKKGLSFASFAAEVGVCKDTVCEWAAQHKAFAEAKKKSKAECESYWEKWAMENMANPKYSSSMWIFNMKARFGWADKVISVNQDGDYPDPNEN